MLVHVVGNACCFNGSSEQACLRSLCSLARDVVGARSTTDLVVVDVVDAVISTAVRQSGRVLGRHIGLVSAVQPTFIRGGSYDPCRSTDLRNSLLVL